MEKKERLIFDTRVKGLLDSMVLNARNEAVATGFYSLNHAPLEIEKAKGEIFDKVFKWPSINLLRNTLKVNHFTKDVSIDTARNILGTLTYSSSSSSIQLLTIVYEIQYNGELDALKLTVNLNQRVVNISMNGGGNLALFFYTQKSISEVSSQIKKEKDQILDIIEENQLAVDEFFEQNKSSILTAINSGFEIGIEKARQHKRDNESLL